MEIEKNILKTTSENVQTKKNVFNGIKKQNLIREAPSMRRQGNTKRSNTTSYSISPRDNLLIDQKGRVEPLN